MREVDRLEHEALDERTPAEWGHARDCLACVMLRAARGESTVEDYLLTDPYGRPIVPIPAARPISRFKC